MRRREAGRPDLLRAYDTEMVMRLKHQITRRRYRVDAEAVAREILFKLRMISAGRRALLADAPEGGQQLPSTPE
jgi:hypothetical protein